MVPLIHYKAVVTSLIAEHHRKLPPLNLFVPSISVHLNIRAHAFFGLFDPLFSLFVLTFYLGCKLLLHCFNKFVPLQKVSLI